MLVDLTWIRFSFLLGTYYIRGDHNVGRVQHAADTHHWCSSRKPPEKNNIHVGICSFWLLGSNYFNMPHLPCINLIQNIRVVYMHKRLTVNNVLKGFLKNEDA